MWKLYVGWALLLIVQNASFTMVSRARNSGSDWYHAVAAVFSNGIWFAAMFITFERVLAVLSQGSVMLGAGIGLIYVTSTVFGSVMSGRLLRTYVEKGKRRVGHYDHEPAPDATQLIAYLKRQTLCNKAVEKALDRLQHDMRTLAGAMQKLGELTKRGRSIDHVLADRLDNLNERMKRAESSLMDIADIWHTQNKLDDEEDERLASYEQMGE